MDWIEEVKIRIKRKNEILFSLNSEFLQDLNDLLKKQSHIAVTEWAIQLAQETVDLLSYKYPELKIPALAVNAAKEWSVGKIKMREAQRKILDCHAAAKAVTDKADKAMFHAVGQACAVVHSVKHAMGYPVYDLTSIVIKYGEENCRLYVENRKKHYIETLLSGKNSYKNPEDKWADFMLK